MSGVPVNLLARATFDDPAEVHDRHPVAHVLDHPEIVGDEQQREPELPLQVVQQVQYLGLDGDVERRHRLVRDDEARADRERARDPDALALAAAELVWIAVRRVGRQADEGEKLVDARAAEEPAADREALVHVADLDQRSEARHTRMHAAVWRAAFSSSAGSSSAQRLMAFGHRSRKWQPLGRRSRSGTWPGIVSSRSRRSLPTPGIERSSAWVYGCSGRSKISSTEACSTIRPAYMIATSSACSATTPRSCVIRSSAIPCCARSARSRSRISAWMVTSSAVVGSSAISTRGSHEIAIAIITRCRMPPESRWGWSRARRAGSGMPTSASSSTARSQASRRETGRWSRTASAIWLPTVSTGLSDVIGSWKIMARPAPRTARMSRSGSVRRSRPSKETLPPTMRPGGGTRRMSERALTLFPQPDSPTSPRTRPASSANDTPSTARASPPSRKKEVRRSRTSRRGIYRASGGGAASSGSTRAAGGGAKSAGSRGAFGSP